MKNILTANIEDWCPTHSRSARMPVAKRDEAESRLVPATLGILGILSGLWGRRLSLWSYTTLIDTWVPHSADKRREQVQPVS